MKQCPTCGEVYEVTKSCPCPVRGGARRGAGKKPIYKQALTRVNVSLDPATIAFYKRHGASLSDGIRQYWRGLTKRAADLRYARRVPCTCGQDDGLHEWDCAISRANRTRKPLGN